MPGMWRIPRRSTSTVLRFVANARTVTARPSPVSFILWCGLGLGCANTTRHLATETETRCAASSTSFGPDHKSDSHVNPFAGACATLSRSSFVDPLSEHCRVLFSALDAGDTSPAVQALIEKCKGEAAIGEYAGTVFIHLNSSVTTYRAHASHQIESSNIAACRWCHVLLQRDLGLSLLLEEPIDENGAESQLRASCRDALTSPPLVFVDGRHPCKFLRGTHDLERVARAASTSIVALARHCDFGTAEADSELVELAW